MPTPSPYAPFSEKYTILEELGKGSGGTVYRALETATEKPVVIKHIPIPASQSDVEALIFSGAAENEEAVQKYYEQTALSIHRELQMQHEEADNAGFFPYIDAQFDQREDAIGYDLYLVSDFAETLPVYAERNAMSMLDVLNLSIDLCTACNEMHALGQMHSNIKPNNIFRTQTGHFLIGDLGLVQLSDLAFSSLPDARFGPYAPPEYHDILSPLNRTGEVYSIGMILYRIFNAGHAPFVDEETSEKTSDLMRLEGKELPTPMFADYEISEILKKACAFQPEDRYADTETFLAELTLYMKRNEVSSAPIVPPIVHDASESLEEGDFENEADPINFTNIEDLDSKFIDHFSPNAREVPAETATEEVPETEPTQNTAEEQLQPEEPGVAESPSVSEEPKPVEKAKKKHPLVWIPIVLAVLVAAALVFGFFYLKQHTATAESLTITDKSDTALTVEVRCASQEAELELLCTDTYGNTFRQPYEGSGTYSFDGLSADTTYSVELSAVGFARITGSSSVLVTTAATTEIVSFTASNVTGTSADLSMVVSGPEPESWSVRYETDSGDNGVFTCTSHSLNLQDLNPGTTYTFTLSADDSIYLQGSTVCSFTTELHSAITAMNVTEMKATSFALAWEYEGVCGTWCVTCETEGSDPVTVETDTPAIAYTDLVPGASYTVTVSCDGLEDSELNSVTVTTSYGEIQSVLADADAGTAELSWVYEGDPIGEEWMVIYTTGTASPIQNAVSSEETSVTLTGLIPDCTYTYEICTASGVKLEGTDTGTFQTKAADKFSANGLTSVYLGLFVKPSSENWTARDLANGTVDFVSGQQIAYAMEAISTISASSDSIDVLCVIRNEAGEAVDAESSSGTWDSMWSGKLYIGSLNGVPTAAGTYTLEIYFNNQLVTRKNFTVT